MNFYEYRTARFATAQDTDWKKHDERFHKGAFDPQSMSCGLRDREGERDGGDVVDPSASASVADPLTKEGLSDRLSALGCRVYGNSVCFERGYNESRSALVERAVGATDRAMKIISDAGWSAKPVGHPTYNVQGGYVSTIRLKGTSRLRKADAELLAELPDGFEKTEGGGTFGGYDVAFGRKPSRDEMEKAWRLYKMMGVLSLSRPDLSDEGKAKTFERWTERPNTVNADTMVPFLTSPEREECERKCDKLEKSDEEALRAIASEVGGRAATASIGVVHADYGSEGYVQEMNHPRIDEKSRYEIARKIAKSFGDRLTDIGIDRDGVHFKLKGPDFTDQVESYWKKAHGSRTI